MCQSKTKPTNRLIAATVASAALGSMLGGCSDLYMDRRDKIGPSAGDAIAINQAMQTNDPWPAHSGNSKLAFNGQKIQSAVERYRTNTPWVPATPVVNPNGPQTQPPTQQTVAPQPANASTAAAPSIAPGTTTTTTTVVSEPNGSSSQSTTTH
jgi:hypothetical protein